MTNDSIATMEIPEIFAPLVELGQSLDSISENNISEISEDIAKAFSEISLYDELASLIAIYYETRRQQQPLYIDLSLNLVSKLTNFKENLKAVAKKNFLRALYERGIFTFHEIEKKLIFDVESQKYFAPETNNLTVYDAEELFGREHTVSQLKKNSWHLFKVLFHNGYLPGTLGECLVHDDLEILTEFAKSPTFDYNTRISQPAFAAPYLPKISIASLCALYGSIRCMRYLILHNCKLDGDVVENAVLGGNTEILRLIDQRGAPMQNALSAAIKYHRHGVFDWLVLRKKCQQPTLSEAARAENLEAVLFLKALEMPTGVARYKKTPLHIAAAAGRGSVVRALSDSDDVEARDINGRTPLHVAAAEGRPAAVSALLDAGADVGALDNAGNTPLHLAAQKGCVRSIGLLLSAGADPHAPTVMKLTPLHMALRSGGSAAASALIAGGADCTARDTALSLPLFFSRPRPLVLE